MVEPYAMPVIQFAPSKRRPRRIHPGQLTLSYALTGDLVEPTAIRASRLKALAGVLMLDAEARIVLLHRTAPAQWELPGGKVEAGESGDEAAAREIEEELGVVVRDLEFLGSTRFRQHGTGWSYSWFLAGAVEGQPSICEPQRFDGVSRWRFSDLTRMMTELSPNVRLLVCAYFDGHLVLPDAGSNDRAAVAAVA